MLKTQVVDGIPEVSVEDVHSHLGQASDKIRIIDVRAADEFKGELGHIEGAELCTLGQSLSEFLAKGNRDEHIVFVCRLGGRSAKAQAESARLGYKNTASMKGGMQLWNDKKLPKK